MASAPNAFTINRDLTNYAFGIMPDFQKAMALLNLLSPVVPTGGGTGSFNKFDTTQAFKQYAQAVLRRAEGGQANRITLMGETSTYTANPFGLNIAIDDHERNRAGDNGQILLEQAKTRTLLINCVVGQLGIVITAIKAAVSATSGKGDWGNANVDPIEELNTQIKAVFLASGMVPNFVAIDFGAWCVLASNPKILKRMPGADIAAVSTTRVGSLLVAPNARVEIVETAGLTSSYGLANTSAAKASVLGGSVLVGFNSPMATPYDPSFCKTFSPTANLFTGISQVRSELEHSDILENDWTADVQVVSSLLCKRIDVTGATS